MKLTGKEDIRVRKTITSIRKAFCEMICERPYEKITVKSLCERAMINKKTFYVYYETLDDLLLEVQDSYTAAYKKELGEYHLPEDLAKTIRLFFEFSAKQDQAYEKITCATDYLPVRNKMIADVMEDHETFPSFSSFENRLMYRFWTDTVLMVYKEWIQDNKKTSLEEVIQFASGLVTTGIEGIYRQHEK